MIICNACKGKGTIRVKKRKKAMNPHQDSWAFKEDGWRYKDIVCPHCEGTGVSGVY